MANILIGTTQIVTIMIDLPHAALVYAMETAHTRYWCVKKSLRSGWRVIETNNGADERTYDVSLMDLARGASLLARIAPIHFGYLINDRADANTTRSWMTGDLLLQLSIFGEIKYS